MGIVLGTPVLATTITLQSVLCPTNKVTVKYHTTGGIKKIYVIVSKSGSPQQTMSRFSNPIKGNRTTDFEFPAGSGPFDVVSIFTTDLDIQRLYTNGCDE